MYPIIKFPLRAEPMLSGMAMVMDADGDAIELLYPQLSEIIRLANLGWQVEQERFSVRLEEKIEDEREKSVVDSGLGIDPDGDA